MIRFSPLIISFLFYISAAGQLDSFDLNAYTSPLIKRSRLESDFSLRGMKQQEELSDFKSVISFNYYRYTRQPKLQNSWNISTTNNFDFNSQNNISLQSRNYIRTNQRHYIFDNKNLYVENNFIGRYSYVYYYFFNSQSNPERSSSRIQLDIPLSVGWGRVEEISSNWRALRMLKAFWKLNILSKNIDDETIRRLADKIAMQKKHKRYFDYRLGSMEQIEDIDHFLSSNKIIDSLSIQYYTSLTDNWYYGINESRFSGSAFSIGIEPVLLLINKSFDNSSIRSYLLLAKYEYHKAISQYWQMDLDFRFRAGIMETTKPIEKHYIVNPFLTYSNSFYPNSRTKFGLETYVQYHNSENKFKYSFYSNINYYLSPKTRIRFIYGIYKLDDRIYNPNSSRYGASPSWYYNQAVFNLERILGQNIDEKWTSFFSFNLHYSIW